MSSKIVSINGETDFRILNLLANFLQVQAEEGIDMSDEIVTVFDSNIIPEITIQEYLSRIVQYVDCSQECYIIAGIYAKRVQKKIPITPYNVHRIMFMGIVIAAKWRDDLYFTNKLYSIIGGISLTEINRMELTLLHLIDWQTNVSIEEYEQVMKEWQLFHSLDIDIDILEYDSPSCWTIINRWIGRNKIILYH